MTGVQTCALPISDERIDTTVSSVKLGIRVAVVGILLSVETVHLYRDGAKQLLICRLHMFQILLYVSVPFLHVPIRLFSV